MVHVSLSQTITLVSVLDMQVHITAMILGVVLNRSESVTAEEVSYNKTSSFSSFYHWNLDKNVSQDDHINQCMQWTRISNAVRIMF